MSVPRQEIVDTLLQYLSRHPGAGDTFEGIARFWMTRQRVDVMVDDVQHALDDEKVALRA